MIKQFDEDASEIAAMRADAPRDQGDEEGYPVWKRVIAGYRGTEDYGAARGNELGRNS
jgi:hypothetical protein